MRWRDQASFSLRAVTAQPMRSFLTSLGIAIGIAAVVLLTAIGEGIHQFVLSEFSQFGTHLLAVNPGKVTTHGTPLGVLGNVRPLTIDDAAALEHLPQVEASVPVMQGNAEVEFANQRRRITVFGVNPDMLDAFTLELQRGQFLPRDDPHTPRMLAVLGTKVAETLFADINPLGEKIRIGGQTYRVIGVMGSKGQIVGFDMDDTVFIPTARALELFNRDGVMEIDVLYSKQADADEIVAAVTRVLRERHGEEDFTLTTQQQMLDVLGSILGILTLAVGALGGISLVVGAVGIISIMTIAVAERTGEIGLLRALGARPQRIAALLLGEAMLLSGIGGLAGLGFGVGGAWLIHSVVPALPVHTAWEYALAAEALSMGIGLLSGVAPALRAARLDPVEALRAE